MQRKTVLFCDSDRTRHLVRNLYSHLDPHVLVVCFKRCSVRQRQRPRAGTRSTARPSARDSGPGHDAPVPPHDARRPTQIGVLQEHPDALEPGQLDRVA